jgi:Spy/CpxP family protein refolding chaperone
VAVTGLSAPAFAQGHGHHGERGEMHQIFSQLDLTATQKESLAQLHKANKEREKELHQAAREARDAFDKAQASNASDSELRAAREQMVQKREAVASMRFEGMLQVRKILTPEQNKKFAELRSQQHREHGERGERGEK